MIDWSLYPEELVPKLKRHRVVKKLRRSPRIFTDTSDFTSIEYGDIIHVDDRYFIIIGHTREGRFGIDDQIKPWVPKVYDLFNDERYIIKLVFHETYELTIGGLKVTCYRSPEKEARVLELVGDHPHFMHGYSVLDEAENLVRILDIVDGRRLDTYISRLSDSHEDYVSLHLPEVLERFLTSVTGIGLLHENGLKHGDIRRDHIFVDRSDNRFRWIDFDYDFYLPERPFALDLYGLGNVLLYLIGKQNFRAQDVIDHPEMGQKVFETLHTGDLSLVAGDRVFNLKKLFPYIPAPLNDILLHFSAGSSVFYNSVSEFEADLSVAVAGLS
ncbi:MAG: serine/threonine protein kinase [Thermodesulfobacteriota bacterium]